MPRAAVRHDDVISEGPLELCAKRGNCPLRREILMVRLERDAAGVHALEGVGELQVFRLDVDAGSVVSGMQPGSAQFHGAMLLRDFEEARRAGDFAVEFGAGDPNDGSSGGDQIKGFVDPGLEFTVVGDPASRPVPDARFEGHSRQIRQVFARKWLQADQLSFKLDRSRIDWGILGRRMHLRILAEPVASLV